MWAENKQGGFTIVELLIVVVVIAILAAVTIVSYTGIQNRARNNQMVAAVRTYYTALKNYQSETGDFPTSYGCLGLSSLYSGTSCYSGSNTYNYSSSLNNALNEYVKTPPNVPDFALTSGDGFTSAMGILYHTAASFGGKYLGFTIRGGTCPIIAGAEATTTSSAGGDSYCRILVK